MKLEFAALDVIYMIRKTKVVFEKLYIFIVDFGNSDSIFRKYFSERFWELNSTHTEKNASAKRSKIIRCKTCTLP